MVRPSNEGGTMKSARLLGAAAVTAFLLVCSNASAASHHSGASHATQRPEVATAIPIPNWLTRTLRSLGRRVLTKENIKRYGKKAGKEIAEQAFDSWVQSAGSDCPTFLTVRFFCTRPPTTQARWGVGQALTWRGRVPGTWSSPGVVRSIRGSLRVGAFYWLTCYAYGDLVSDGGISTRLWYRLRSGVWVNDGWVDTGTNDVIPGVSRC
jgi:hypothetical protein